MLSCTPIIAKLLCKEGRLLPCALQSVTSIEGQIDDVVPQLEIYLFLDISRKMQNAVELMLAWGNP